MTNRSDQVISLFSGAGGLSKGFALAGCKPFAGVEIDKNARQTYEANLGVTCHGLDLGKVTSTELRAQLGIKAQPFAIVGGPPCQGFSSAGMRAAGDPRNRLIFNYLHIVEEMKPRWFLFENVEGLLTSNGGASVYNLAREFIRLGYAFRIEKVNFAGFGIPQARKRVVIVGNSVGLDFTFPEYSHSYNAGKHRWRGGLPPSPTLAEATAGLGKPVASSKETATYASESPQNAYDGRMREGNSTGKVGLHFLPPMSEQDLQRMTHLRPGQTMKDLPEHLWHDSFRRRAFRRVMDGTPTERRGGAPSGLKRLRSDLNCLTITGAATQEFVHPSENRTLTLRECARVQSFRDDFHFVGGPRSVAQQIGNAVPPLAAQVLGRMIVALDGTLGSGKAVPTPTGGSGLLGFHLTNATGMSPALARTQSLLASLMDEMGLFGREEITIAAG
ncbi:MAG: DNA cytosine methyltransferase [Dongiaceae bacterium]